MIEFSCWIKPRQIKDVDEYLFAINQIQNATTGFVNVIESNQFFIEACQCLINAINLFQQGYFDAAFYMLRQSIETSIGTLYLVSNKENVYRLALDAFPVALADDDLALRSPCLLTESLSIDFLEKYIGKSFIDGYKHTQIYKDTADWLKCKPKQSETVFYLIHYQIVNRNLMEEYYKQWDILEFDDQLAVQIFLICNKICRLYLYGMIPYTSETISLNSEMVLGDSYFKEIFAESHTDYNLKYKKAYISRVTIGTDYTYIEHNEVLSSDEIREFQDYALKVSNEYKNTFEELMSFREPKQFD